MQHTADDRQLRCPDCRSFDWYRDGFAMHELPEGSVVRQRLTDSADRETPWSCAQCGYEVQPHTVLRSRLDAAGAPDPARPRIAAAFAGERDAAVALQLASALDEPVDYALRRVVGEGGETRMVIVEAECESEPTCDQVETILVGAHGVRLPPEAERPA